MDPNTRLVFESCILIHFNGISLPMERRAFHYFDYLDIQSSVLNYLQTVYPEWDGTRE